MKNISHMVLVFCALIWTTSASGMEFEVEYSDMRPIFPPSLQIHMSGPITSDDPLKLLSIFEDYKDAGLRDISITLDSPGGSLMAGILMGRLLSRRTEVVTAQVGRYDKPDEVCASACVLIYLGADYRYFNQEKGKLGVHRFSMSDPDLDANEALATAQEISATIVSYITEMRADPKLFDRMSNTPAEGIDWISFSDLEEWRVVTGPVFSETSEYRNLNGSIALELNHVAVQGESSMILFCGERVLVGVATLHEPELTMVGRFSLVIDGEEVLFDDWTIISRENKRTRVAFNLPNSWAAATANAKTFGARIVLPSDDMFYGFEQNIRDRRLQEIVRGCKLSGEASKPPASATVIQPSRHQMTSYPGRDIIGSDILEMGIKDISYEQCQAVCAENRSCAAVSYVIAQSWCWPKFAVKSSKAKAGIISATKE